MTDGLTEYYGRSALLEGNLASLSLGYFCYEAMRDAAYTSITARSPRRASTPASRARRHRAQRHSFRATPQR